MVQLSHPYMTTGKTIALSRQSFVDRVMSLLFNMLSRFVIAFLPRSKHLLISWLQSPSAVILEHKKIKSVTVSIVSSSICREVLGLDAMILVFRRLSFKAHIRDAKMMVSSSHSSGEDKHIKKWTFLQCDRHHHKRCSRYFKTEKREWSVLARECRLSCGQVWQTFKEKLIQ